VQVSADSTLIEEKHPFVAFAGVVPPGVGLEGNLELVDHADSFLRPFLLRHCRNHAVVGLAELLP
jgi:hypothetical protein